VEIRFVARAGFGEELARILGDICVKTREEPGCLGYELHRDRKDADRLMLYETWRSLEDLALHRTMPYSIAFRAHASRLLREDFEVTIWDRL